MSGASTSKIVLSAKSRLTSLMALTISLAALVLGRAAMLQLVPSPRLEQMARRQFESHVLIRPPRGTIHDRNGEPLAVNVEANSLAANPSKIDDRRALAHLIAKATEIPYRKVLERLSLKKEFVWIKRHLSDGDLARLKVWHVMEPNGDLAQGLWLVKESKRVYPHGELASHVLGDVNIDLEGLEGIELWFNDKLRGKVVSVQAVRDALGRPTFIDAVAARHVRDGEPVKLTLDASLQYSVEEELAAAVKKHGARGGTVIVMNAVNGEVLAMANQPSFNPNDAQVPVERRRNRAMTDGYEPGSTVKPILLAAALSRGMKLTDQIWGERGEFEVQGKRISEAEAREKFEWLTLKKIVQVSSNIGAAKLALKVGTERYSEMLRALGLTSRSETGFPGEISGYLPPNKIWQPLTLANVGFGQGLFVTPMQMIRAYAAFANGGWLVQPSLVRTEGPEGRVAPKRILTQRIVNQVLEALESVTQTGGTGVAAALEGYRVAGKTGTAQTVDPETHRYSRSRHIPSFIGFPLDVEPKIVIYTSLDSPQGAFFASETAAPLFHEVLNAVASRFGLPAKVNVRQLASADSISLAQAHPAPTAVNAASVAQALTVPGAMAWQGATSDGKFLYRMPSLEGLGPREALGALSGHDFQVEVQGMGIVKSQSPPVGKSIAEGEKIRLVLSDP